MSHRISPQDLILQRSLSSADDLYSVGSTFTLQDRVEAIEHSSEEFYEMVSEATTLSREECFPESRKEKGFSRISHASYFL